MALVLTFTLALVALPMFVSGRGTRALAFGWLAFALFTALARPPRVTSGLGVDAR